MGEKPRGEAGEAGPRFEPSNLDKVFFAEPGVTKGDVVDYYTRIAPLMLEHVAGRALVLERFPDGVDGGGFYQKNTPAHVPEWIERVEIPTADGGATTYSVIHDVEGLAYMANQAALVIHTPLATAAAPHRPVEVMFDLDPADDDPEPVQDAARMLREELDALGLAPRVKSSGRRGLHILVDVIDDQPSFELTAAFARVLADRVARRGGFTLEHRKAAREGRLFLDVLRNAPAAHAVAPYSLRALPEAPISVPLDWDEALGPSFHPRRITIGNVFRRIGQQADPWAERPRPHATIRAAIAALAER